MILSVLLADCNTGSPELIGTSYSRIRIQAFIWIWQFYSSSDPPEVPRAPDSFTPPVHLLQGGLRQYTPEWAMEHHAAVPLPSNEARWRTLPGRWHLKRGARQQHPWHDPLPIPRIYGIDIVNRTRANVWGVHPTQKRSSKNWIKDKCDENEVPACWRLRSSGKLCDNLEVVKEFRYLGSVVTSHNNIIGETRKRIVEGNRTYYGLQRLLRSSRLRARTKWHISHIDSPGGPLRTRVLDHPSGECQRSGRVSFHFISFISFNMSASRVEHIIA